MSVFDRVVDRLNRLLRPCESALTALFDEPLTRADIEACQPALLELSRWLEDLGSPSEGRKAIKISSGLERRRGATSADPGWAVEAAEMIEEIRSIFAVLPSGTNTDGARLLFVGPVTDDLDTLTWSALGAGFVVEHAGLDDDVKPDLVLIAAPAGNELSSAAEPVDLARRARLRHPDALILVAKEVVNLAEQLTLGGHCDALVAGVVKPTSLLEEVHQLLDRRQSNLHLVQFASARGPSTEELRQAGLHVTVATKLSGVVTELLSGRANAVIVTSTYVGEHDELIGLIRTRPEMRKVAIIETTTLDRGPAWTSDPGSRPDAHVPVELGSVGVLEAVLELVRRRSEIGASARSGTTTGLPWFSGRAGAERLLVSAKRRDQPVTVGIIRFEGGRAKHEIDEIQAELSRQFRDDDVVARRSDDENLVAMSGIDRRTAMSRLDGIVRRFDALTPRAVIAEFPYDGGDFDTLIETIDAALDRSDGLEADPVIGIDWSERSKRADDDVLLIEPDADLAAVLEATLNRVGITATTTPTGDAALSLLLDPTAPKPRLVVLEFDLPGLDGLSVLRQLDRAKALTRLNVVMLGARTRESDLAAAFDLGVIDVVPKPVSPRMAVRRFQRSMDR